jgi:2-polyprenyl-3-methyl-5-hydroxy-6-metoxy-1,4-benzoquinol methylase
MDKFTQANREAWNLLAKTHSESYHIGKLLAGEPLLNDLIRGEVGDVRGKSLIHLLCHIGTDTLSWGLLGAQVTGVDISPEAIQYARQLALQSGIDASFITSDVMDLLDQPPGTYDIVFSSTGVLCWIPDIDRFAATVRKLLKPGGFFYLNDGHPFRIILELNEQGLATVKNDYFHRGAYEYDSFTDYSVQNLVIPARSYEWDWTIGDIVTAFCQNGMRIAFLHEFPQFYYGGYPGYDVEIDKPEIYPCTFSLKAIAEG